MTKGSRSGVGVLWVAGVVVALLLSRGSESSPGGEIQSAAAVPHAFEGDLRRLPKVEPWPAGTPMREGPVRRKLRPEAVARPPRERPRHSRDPLLELQAQSASPRQTLRAFSVPDLNFDGLGNSGVVPPDTVGEIGVDYYIQITNGPSGSLFSIFDKGTGSLVVGPSDLSSLWSGGGACATGGGDPIVLYDQLAGRWLLSEFAASGNHLCVYISQSNDPISGGWFNYDFEVGEFPDYPKYAVWPDAYYVSSNESSPAGYALDRASMLAGLPATFQRLTATRLSGFPFQALIPSDLDGSTPPPTGSPNFFMRHRDDEVHDPGSNDPGADFLEIWEFAVDFDTPANSTFTLAATISVTEFESELCGLSSFECVPQKDTGQLLDPLREVVMWRLQYRNFGTHQTLVGTFVTDVDGGAADHHGMRWFELRRVGTAAWSLFQEGTYAPDSDHRWLGSIAMDGSGNIALGYSISSSATFPGIRYVGRTAGDPGGSMTTGEVIVVAGGASQTSSTRWGDYSSMNVDPVDDCTFWYTNEYVPLSGSWTTRIARFRFADPTCTDAPPPECGNDQRELAEECDGSDAAACPGLCQVDCTCPPPDCGNNVTEAGEGCDGSDDAACPGACLPPGDPQECQCPPPVCGNNVTEVGEECDGSDDAACPGTCLPPGDPQECQCPSSCGDAICDPGEDELNCATDCGCAAPGACGAEAPAGCFCDSACLGFGDCCPDACSACGVCEPACGNNVTEAGEECDGSDDAACPGACLPPGDPQECQCPSSCGDASCDPGEDELNCAIDCGCAIPGACGADSPAGCSCDSGCLELGDCCPDACSACGLCEPVPACPPTPRVGCRQSAVGTSQLRVKNRDDSFRDQLKWKWAKGDATLTTEFLDPVGSDAATYTLCVYDSSVRPQPAAVATVGPMGSCGGKPCWKATGSRGFRYRDKAATADGVTDLKFKSGVSGKARILMKGKGPNLDTPTLPLMLPVTAQVIIEDGATSICWDTQYTTATRNDVTQFTAFGP